MHMQYKLAPLYRRLGVFLEEAYKSVSVNEVVITKTKENRQKVPIIHKPSCFVYLMSSLNSAQRRYSIFVKLCYVSCILEY